jgi:hypothetical protein
MGMVDPHLDVLLAGSLWVVCGAFALATHERLLEVATFAQRVAEAAPDVDLPEVVVAAIGAIIAFGGVYGIGLASLQVVNAFLFGPMIRFAVLIDLQRPVEPALWELMSETLGRLKTHLNLSSKLAPGDIATAVTRWKLRAPVTRDTRAFAVSAAPPAGFLIGAAAGRWFTGQTTPLSIACGVLLALVLLFVAVRRMYRFGAELLRDDSLLVLLHLAEFNGKPQKAPNDFE